MALCLAECRILSRILAINAARETCWVDGSYCAYETFVCLEKPTDDWKRLGYFHAAYSEPWRPMDAVDPDMNAPRGQPQGAPSAAYLVAFLISSRALSADLPTAF